MPHSGWFQGRVLKLSDGIIMFGFDSSVLISFQELKLLQLLKLLQDVGGKSGKHLGELNMMSTILSKIIQSKGWEGEKRDKGKPSLTE